MRWLGSIVALLVCLISGYEFVALNSSLPTISRIVQGWRDDGATTAVTVLAAAVAGAAVYFAVWIWRHFRSDRRSRL